ncbi:TPA: cell envelope biogenesis protein TolA [Serratia marcescens]|uniref:cell envelope integrity TolA C-terminal domain-containing protein n=1 Tax=Serratia TaxID=613 RepID=UPI000650B4CE|nr:MULTISPECIES: cell envelope integrity TolA C-terminal domain-containing protein [Serratia]AWC69527.1 cell envelope biogenesis protein TolA [Serratia marcescens]AWC87475.1 cell envelope biogenesis protein TolA [Serratia marcescens]AWS60329.1 cell envelope biogenesis protein TolA [Serratia marcescens]AWS67227.1 cell envelope biogenesis protein TolA [Serratia marcescens]ELH4206312.1 cell envelope biogenesis protein TolA [Serratia marcescens]
MKKTLGLLALLLLSGCGAGRQAGIPLPQPQATAPLSYPVRVHNAVSREQRLPERARGQRCTISIRLRPDGKLASSKIVRGDAPRCAAASAAVQRAQFPPMANATEYALFNAVVLDFVP